MLKTVDFSDELSLVHVLLWFVNVGMPLCGGGGVGISPCGGGGGGVVIPPCGGGGGGSGGGGHVIPPCGDRDIYPVVAEAVDRLHCSADIPD